MNFFELKSKDSSNERFVLFSSYLVLSWIFVMLIFPPRVLAQAPEEQRVAMAREFVTNLVEGRFQQAIKDFDPTMKKLVTPEKMASVWESLLSQVGAYKNIVEVRSEVQAGYDIVYLTCAFEKTLLDVKIVFDRNMQIAGQFFVPAHSSSRYRTPEYADMQAFEEEEVQIGVEGWLLPGTLSVPRGASPFPAVVLVHGSGPNDRDESIGPNKPFKDIAWGLASRGIAVLRYDKRTRVHRKKMLAEPGTRLTVYEEVIEDVLAAVAFLRTRPEVDRNRIVVLGHSLGGTLVPRIANHDAEISGFIIMAGAASPLEDLFLKQVDYVARLDGRVTEEEKSRIEKTRQIVERIKRLQPSDASRKENLLGASPEYWLDLKNYRPALEARKIGRPLLILQGRRDYQVTLADFQSWRETLRAHKNVCFRLYPDLNHLFLPGSGKSSPAEYQVPGHVDERVIQDIARWIHALEAFTR